VANYQGVTGDMIFDPNCKNISPMFLAAVHNGTIEYRRITMEKPYARVGEEGVQYAGPELPDEKTNDLRIAVFGAQADQIAKSPDVSRLLDTLSNGGRHFSVIGISSDGPWGKASTELVRAMLQERVLGVIALDRNTSHLAEQIGTKTFVPVVAISSDRALTSTNVPWVFRLPQGTPLEQALRCFADVITKAGPNRGKIREALASGTPVAGLRFQSTGELK
jgi:hypothetical protein